MPDYAIPPGDTLADVLQDRGMTQQELALRTGMAAKTINEIAKGKAPITAETALKLELIFGVKASFWLKLEMNYQEDLARIRAKEGLVADAGIARKCPYPQMAELGWVPPTRNAEEKAANLRSFHGIASLELLELMPLAANFRRHYTPKTSFHALAAWLRKAVLDAERTAIEPYSKKDLRESIPLLRELAAGSCRDFSQSFDQARKLCAGCGVALTIVPHLPKTSVNGATQWVSPEKVVISLSLRYGYWDMFWFSFFHELGHLVKGHSKKEIYVNYDDGDDDAREEEANRFAADTLIPPKRFQEFMEAGCFGDDAVEIFAKKVKTNPVIVLGRLCKEGVFGWERFSWSRFDRKLPIAPGTGMS